MWFFVLQLPHAFVNCVECFTARLLFEQILNQLYNHCPGPENEFSSYERCDTFNEFVRFYKRAITSRGLENETVYIVSSFCCCNNTAKRWQVLHSIKKLVIHVSQLEL